MNRSLLFRSGISSLLLLFTSMPVRAYEPHELMKYLPVSSNTVGHFNVASIMNTNRAKKEGWEKLNHTEFLAGAIPVHPSIERILVGTELVPGATGRSLSYSVAPVKKAIDLNRLAGVWNGTVQDVGDEKVVGTGNGLYFLKLGDQLLGALRTENRQDVSRWLRYAKSPTTNLQSNYLGRTMADAGRPNHILIVIDTEELFDTRRAGVAVALSQCLEQDKTSADAILKFLTGLKGVRFAANIKDDGIEAEIRFDSKTVRLNVTPELFRAFILEGLDRNGAHLEDLQAATVKITENTATMTFKISDEELALVTSLVMPPAANISESDILRVNPAGANAEASQRYFQAVNKITDEVRRRKLPKERRDNAAPKDIQTDKQYETTALWHDTAAKRIETISVLNVDKDVVAYGLGNANRLRAIADSLRGVPIQRAALESQAYYYEYRSGIGPWSSYSANSNLPQIYATEQALIQKDRQNRDQLWELMDQQRAQIRRDMAAKYKVDFDGSKKR